MDARMRLVLAVAVVFLALAGLNAWLQHTAAPHAPSGSSNTTSSPDGHGDTVTRFTVLCVEGSRARGCAP